MPVPTDQPQQTQVTPATSALRAGDVAIDGLFSGVLGGLTVAVFFLIVDTLKGQPLFTPSLLGSVLFLGRSVEAVDGVNIPMVFAYTGVHMAVFVAVGMAAAYMVSQFEKNPPFGLLLLLFICFEAGFVAVTLALMPGVVGALGTSLVVISNLLSAAVMAGYLLWWSHPQALRSLDRVWGD
jgi:hypothetical protein